MSEPKGVRIDHRTVGASAPPFVAAEISGNHNQSLERALAIVEAAAESGAHGLKLQTYTPDTMTMNVDREEFYIRSTDNPWSGRHLYELYEQAYTPWEWHETLFRRARELGMIPFSTPFDETAVDFLEELDTPFYKIASFENNHIPLIQKAASTGKPLVISTGMATLDELDHAVRAARAHGCEQLILLKCTSSYPAPPEESNLKTLPHLRTLFDCEVGLSDHTPGAGAALASVALGAVFIEKHFTLSRADGGVDAEFSLEPPELALLVRESETAWRALGHVAYGPTAAESGLVNLRRSLYFGRDCPRGHVLTEADLKIIRPGGGLPSYLLDQIIGLPLAREVSRGAPVRFEDFKPNAADV